MKKAYYNPKVTGSVCDVDTYSDRSLIQQKRDSAGCLFIFKEWLNLKAGVLLDYAMWLFSETCLDWTASLQMTFPGEDPSVPHVLNMWQNDNQGHEKLK